MATWDILTKEQVSSFIRVPEDRMVDDWYDMAIGHIESHTGWYLDPVLNITEIISGAGADYIVPDYVPISSVTSIQVNGITVPPTYYVVSWDMIQLKSHRPDDVTAAQMLYTINDFTLGSKNINISYSSSGYNGLPRKYKEPVKLCIYFICKEISVNFRGEGSDQIMRKYRPDRTMNPEEVLMGYGQHGKIMGILNTLLPQHKRYS